MLAKLNNHLIAKNMNLKDSTFEILIMNTISLIQLKAIERIFWFSMILKAKLHTYLGMQKMVSISLCHSYLLVGFLRLFLLITLRVFPSLSRNLFLSEQFPKLIAKINFDTN